MSCPADFRLNLAHSAASYLDGQAISLMPELETSARGLKDSLRNPQPQAAHQIMGWKPRIGPVRRCIGAFLARYGQGQQHLHPTFFQLNLHQRARAARRNPKPQQMK